MDSILAWIFGLFAMLTGVAGPTPPQYNGYVEADYVYVAPESAGRIVTMNVREGNAVSRGETLFTLEAGRYRAAVRGAEAREAAARANWQNLETGSRKAEIDVIKASLDRAGADQALAEANLKRTMRLHDQGVTAMAKVDQDRATLQSANAQVAQLQAQLHVAELPARTAQLNQARANYEAAQADADKARLDLAERVVKAHSDGQVQKVYFNAGEVVAAGTPVLSILPPNALKVEFFIPEAERSQFTIGEVMHVECDGCTDGLTATLGFLANDPEHTPPIIYSRAERSRMVFRAEAHIEDAAGLLPGQPVALTVPK